MSTTLTTEQFDKLAEKLTDRVEDLVKERWTNVSKKQDDILDAVNDLTKNLNDDRTNLSQMKIDTAGILKGLKVIVELSGQNIEQLADSVNIKTQETIETTADKVAEKVEPAIQNAINKIKSGIPLTQKRPMWKFWG